MEGADILGRLLQHRQKFRLHRGDGFLHLLLGNQHRLRAYPIKTLGKLQHRLVSPGPDSGDDVRHRRFHIGPGNDPGENFRIRHLAVLHDLDHWFSSTCLARLSRMARMASSRKV